MSEHTRKAAFQSRRHIDGKDDRVGGWRALRWKSPVRYAALGITILTIALLFPRATSVNLDYEIGSIWSGDTIRAPFAFPLNKDDATYEKDVDKAMADVLPVFVPTGMTLELLKDTLFGVAQSIAISENAPTFLSDRGWKFVQSISAEKRPEEMTKIAQALFDGLAEPFRAGVINRKKSALPKEKIIVRRSEIYEDAIPINLLYDTLDVVHTIEMTLPKKLNPEETAFATDLYYALFVPTYIYSEPLTQEMRENAKASAMRSQGIVGEDEIIVATGDRITELTRLKLNSYMRSRVAREEEGSVWWQLVGNIGHVSILIGLAVLYLYNFRRRIYYDNLQLGIILMTVLLMAILSFLSRALEVSWPIEFLILMPFLSMLLAILFDSRTAFYLTVVTSFLVAGVRGSDYSVAIACLTAGVMAAYTVRDIKSRTQLFRSIGFSLLGYSLAIVALGLERGSAPVDIGLNLTFAAVNAILSPVLTFGVIWLVENLFGITTDLKLLEYDNLNHPLLRALADKAPGTYQHTLTIARLAESAAVAIAANPLLTKVGAYFHDVGKIAKAEYFVENQMQMGNKHDKIKPEMSAKIIRNHVIDGMELAREYRLPQRIIDFIPMHHGTTTIKYFLDKALETNPDVNENDFRYPGPLPQSRETAIVMLADAVEATTRSLPNPTPKAIEETIDRVIKKRFSEGQLDQCELTLADLTKIKKAFIKNLIGMSHPRIQYKSDDPQAEAKPELPAERKKESPMIPYIDDAFGNVDVEISYRKRKEE